MSGDRTDLAIARYRRHAAGYDASAARTERETTMFGMGYIAWGTAR